MQSSIYADLEVKYDSKMTVLCTVKKSNLWCISRCTVQECCGTPMWPLSWYWPLKMTDYQSSKCGTSVLPHPPSRFLRTTQGEVFNSESGPVCFSFFSYVFFSLPGEFCRYPGARLTLNSCWVVLRTTGSYAGIQTLERYIMSSAASWLFLSYLSLFTWPDDKAMDPHR